MKKITAAKHKPIFLLNNLNEKSFHLIDEQTFEEIKDLNVLTFENLFDNRRDV